MATFDDDIGSFVDDPVMSIGTLAERLGASVSVLRKYENVGLLIPHRTETGRRLYSPEDVERVRNIQHLIQDVGLNIEGIRRMQALLPCWSFFPCDKNAREKCDAYSDTGAPCWTIQGVGCAPKGNECRSCVVYRFGSLCTENIKRLLHDQIALNDVNAALWEMMLRKRKGNGIE
ncbi:MAG: MerR family transcriptional regulator [Planctomycetota bacterium]|jgi:MerR family transcriptional regulator/heat shock protein HspR